MNVQITMQTLSTAAIAITFLIEHLEKAQATAFMECDERELVRLRAALQEIQNGGVL